LSRQRLPDGASAELLSERSGLLGQRRWRVERVGLSRVWGVVEELAPGVDLQLVEIPAGTFVMGSPAGEEGRDVYKNGTAEWKNLAAVAGKDVEAQRQVTVPACWLGRFPITQAQWRVVAGWPRLERELDPDPARFKGADWPVEQVSWEEALEFCRRLSRSTGRAYSLPSEALWEWACRAGTTTPFHFGATLSPEVANFRASVTYGDGPKGEFREHTTPVGLFPANAWGLHDLHGNVLEWCLDRWHPSPRHGPSDGRPWLEPSPEVPSEGRDLRLLRGGSWFNEPHICRSAYRNSNHPGNRNDNVGFRVCCLPPAPFTARAVGWESSGSARRVQTRSCDPSFAPWLRPHPAQSLIRTAPAG
jgi:formylglycine-generating enzyme required for sulfatase activity